MSAGWSPAADHCFQNPVQLTDRRNATQAATSDRGSCASRRDQISPGFYSRSLPNLYDRFNMSGSSTDHPAGRATARRRTRWVSADVSRENQLKTLSGSLRWDTQPAMTLQLLSSIRENPRLRASLYPSSILPPLPRWIAEKALCLEVLKDTGWMELAEEAGYVRRKAVRIDGASNHPRGDVGRETGWEATDQWKSGYGNPVRARLLT